MKVRLHYASAFWQQINNMPLLQISTTNPNLANTIYKYHLMTLQQRGLLLPLL